MEQTIRHRRLYAFFQSKVLNGLMILIVVCLLMATDRELALFPLACGALALILFAGYSLWVWIRKPASLVINNTLSTLSSLYTLYFLIVRSIDLAGEWWSLAPTLLSIPVLMVALCGYGDREFAIK